MAGYSGVGERPGKERSLETDWRAGDNFILYTRMDRRRRQANWLWQARLLRCLIDNASQKSPKELNLSPERMMITWGGLDDDDGRRLCVDLMRDCGKGGI